MSRCACSCSPLNLVQLRTEVLAYVGRDLLAAGEDRIGERTAPVLGGEGQMGVEVVDDATTTPNVRVRRGLAW
jgi:hypothetical protein